MRPIIRFIDFFLFTSLFTACCAMGLCMATERLINNAAPALLSQLHLLVFGSTMLVYNTPRIVKNPYGKKRPSHPYKLWFHLFFVAGLVITAVGLYAMPLQVQLWSVGLGMFAFAYFLPVLPFKSRKRIRDYGWLKIAVLTLVWTTATAVLPILYWQHTVAAYPFEVLLRMVFIFSLCVLFDLRDVQHDVANNIYTLPQRLGISNSYRIIHVALILLALLSIVQYMRYPSPARLAAGIVTAAATWVVAGYLRKNPSDRAYAALADGVMIIYAVVVML